MKIAIPTENGKLCAHFGHCQKFAIVETKEDKVISIDYLEPPVHQPGVYPKFLADKGAKVIIAGGMGVKAQQLFAAQNIAFEMGVGSDDPKQIVINYLQKNLKTGENLCNHDEDHECE
ncbi:MAG: NifB/NifX family molybdenum-iron cluster-binding protein [Candidatus Cloacimonadota bacterium]|nr:NifB/NifX family molybdenum-iron cluster-binding protein [Candidatus Cloacimonadota bacterium]